MVRTFIAIDLPAEIREGMADVQKLLARTDARLTFVRPEQMHITLRFIGEIDVPLVEKIRAVLSGITFSPFSMTLGGVGGNDPRRPRVIWANAEDRGESARMHGAIDRALAPLGIEPESRFTPHATIARVRRFDPSLLPLVREVSETCFGTFIVRSCSLKKSTLTPKGPIYEEIMEVRF
ncbi:MAG: RNA 2',3'-cyclic phosphodiesterase [Methanomicrobiaceae archaeon]|nr:RNA 2',3'-cyclic phosphodiesterase [Methanomicrobiaceae archaeon]